MSIQLVGTSLTKYTRVTSYTLFAQNLSMSRKPLIW